MVKIYKIEYSRFKPYIKTHEFGSFLRILGKGKVENLHTFEKFVQVKLTIY